MLLFSISDLQYGAYPLIAPQNESFPETYISTRHDLITTVFNRTVTNQTVQLDNPLRGTWFAMVKKTSLIKFVSVNLISYRYFLNVHRLIQNPKYVNKALLVFFVIRICDVQISASSCNIYLTSWLDYQPVPVLLTLTANQPLQIVLSNNMTFVYAS